VGWGVWGGVGGGGGGVGGGGGGGGVPYGGKHIISVLLPENADGVNARCIGA